MIEAGHKALTTGFDVSNHGSAAGGFAFSYGLNLALELPDGRRSRRRRADRAASRWGPRSPTSGCGSRSRTRRRANTASS